MSLGRDKSSSWIFWRTTSDWALSWAPDWAPWACRNG